MEKSRSWPSAHDWKSCIPQKGIEGSNPSFSAKIEPHPKTDEVLFFMMERVDLKGRPDQREGKKASSGYFFSPWENPSLFGRSPEDCERKAKSISVTARPWFHKSLLLRQKQPPIFTDVGLLFYNEGLEQSSITVRQVIAHRRRMLMIPPFLQTRNIS